MKPVEFPEANRKLKGHGAPMGDLLVWSDGEQCVSCWRPSWRERLSILFFGRVWLALLSGSTQHPAYVGGQRRYFAKETRA